MDRKLRWGLLATGNIAHKFARGVADSKTGTVHAVASRTEQRAKAFAEEMDVPKAYAGYDRLLEDDEVDIVYIATPNTMHKEWALRAAEAGKHILCEKPVALNAQDAREMIDAAANKDVFFMEAFMYRCADQTHKIIQLLRDGAVGEVRMIRAAFCFHTGYDPDKRQFSASLGGGGIIDVGGYTVSMSRMLAGVAEGRFEPAEPVKVQGVGRVGESGVDEWAAANLEFETGIVAQVACGVRVRQDNRVQVFGSEGMLDVPWPWIPAREGGDTKLIITPRSGDPEEIVVSTDRYLYGLEADAVAEHIHRRQAPFPCPNWQDTIDNMEVLDAWRKQIGMIYPGE
ncbi:MAG: Gfo/Idh/MocA family protein [Phycisphaerae bacterium]